MRIDATWQGSGPKHVCDAACTKHNECLQHDAWIGIITIGSESQHVSVAVYPTLHSLHIQA